MENIAKQQCSYAGMMSATDFKEWYSYLKWRIVRQWSTEDLSFLLGKPSYYYDDFEKLHKVPEFLRRETELLSRIYNRFEKSDLLFDMERHEMSDQRLVRMVIENGSLSNEYRLSVPWEFTIVKRTRLKNTLSFTEEKGGYDLGRETEILLQISLFIEHLIESRRGEIEYSALDLFAAVKKEEINNSFCIRPRHVKKVLYAMIQQERVILRKSGERFVFTQNIYK